MTANPPSRANSRPPPKTTSPAPDFDTASAINQAKSELVAEGQDISGPNCGKIVERACRYMPGGAGLLAKNYGNAYNGHSVDYIVMPDGRAWDVVSGCGDATPTGNTPSANAGCCGGPSGCESNSRYMPCP